MKILLFTLEYPPKIGGVGNYYANLVNHWPDKDNILVYDISADKKHPKTNFYYWPKIARVLNKKIKKEKISQVLVGHILPLGAIVYLASFFSSFKYSVCLHGLDYSSAKKSGYKKLLSFAILKRANKIICANSYLLKTVKKDFPSLKNKLIISNPGAKISSLDEKIKDDLKRKYNLEGKNIIFSLGRLVKRKGFDYSIIALAKLKKSNYKLYQNTCYLIAGVGPEEENLRNLAKKEQVSEKVLFLNNIDNSQKMALYSLCQLFLMPSRKIKHDYEGFGIVYLEANLFKKPVIAGNSGGVSDAVIDNLNGLLVNPDSISDIASAILKLLTDKDYAKILGEKGYQRAKNDFNWTNLSKILKEKL